MYRVGRIAGSVTGGHGGPPLHVYFLRKGRGHRAHTYFVFIGSRIPCTRCGAGFRDDLFLSLPLRRHFFVQKPAPNSLNSTGSLRTQWEEGTQKPSCMRGFWAPTSTQGIDEKEDRDCFASLAMTAISSWRRRNAKNSRHRWYPSLRLFYSNCIKKGQESLFSCPFFAITGGEGGRSGLKSSLGRIS